MPRNLNDIEVFYQVVEAGSFTAAAKARDVPTSTISRRIARLEEQLGTRLLQRTTRTLQLTGAGALLFEHGSRALAELDAAEALLKDLQVEAKGLLRVSGPMEFDALIEVISDFLRRYPSIQIDLDLSNRTVDLVQEGFDIAIRAGELGDSSLISRKLAEGGLGIYASPSYLQKNGYPNTLSDLNQHSFVVFVRGGDHGSTPRWPAISGHVLDRAKSRLNVNRLSAVKAAVLNDLGIAIMPTFVCAPEIYDGTIIEIFPGSLASPTPMWAVYPSRRFLPAKTRVFLDFLEQNFENYLCRFGIGTQFPLS